VLLSPLPAWDIRSEFVLFRVTWDERKHLVLFQQGQLLYSIFFNKIATGAVVTCSCFAKQSDKYSITDCSAALFHLCKLRNVKWQDDFLIMNQKLAGYDMSCMLQPLE
jgi:hypothetical protein